MEQKTSQKPTIQPVTVEVVGAGDRGGYSGFGGGKWSRKETEQLYQSARREAATRNRRHAATQAAMMWLSFLFVVACLIAAYVLGLVVKNAHAMDRGQWEGQTSAVREWFSTVLQPNSMISCCGEADAYWADQVETAADGSIVAIITDDRPDGPLRRMPVPIGTRIPVPADRITWKQGNPTGHVVIFLNVNRVVLCYVQNGGV